MDKDKADEKRGVRAGNKREKAWRDFPLRVEDLCFTCFKRRRSPVKGLGCLLDRCPPAVITREKTKLESEELH